jgi:hypothetical protein
MKIGRLIFVLFVVIFAVAAILGCVTKTVTVEKEVIKEVFRTAEPPPREEPVTPANLERLQEMKDYAGIDKYQFVLVHQIKLDLVKSDRKDHTNVPPKGAIFENVRVRNQITFPDKTLGQAVGNVSVDGDKISLRVYFEAPQDESKYPAATHYLVFSARKSEQTGYFYLEHDDPRIDTISDEKGTLKYGPDMYTLMFDERPYLLMRLERKMDTDELVRTVGGRRIP